MTSNEQHGGGNGADPSLSQVRELLFGEQARDFDDRIQKMESRLRQGLDELKLQFDQRLSGLEAHLRDELAHLGESIVSEQKLRGDSLQEIAASLSGEIGRNVEELTRRMESAQNDLKQQTLQHSQSMADEVRSQLEEMRGRMNSELEQLKERSAARSTLGEMFRQMADRLAENA